MRYHHRAPSVRAFRLFLQRNQTCFGGGELRHGRKFVTEYVTNLHGPDGAAYPTEAGAGVSSLAPPGSRK
jgi:hypothetical protein